LDFNHNGYINPNELGLIREFGELPSGNDNNIVEKLMKAID